MLSYENLLGGRYRLGSRLGRGGMGEVRLGLDVKLGRAVAIKVLSPELAGDPAARERFQREARSAARLNHPSIVAVFDTGEAEDPVTGVSTPYIVMELVEGQTLGTLLRRGDQLPTKRALQLIDGVLEALAHSHDAGIVHQDIKPGNVMLDQSGEVKVMDFGIARSISDTPDGSTPAVTVLGSVRYLSPEQARGETTDVRSDIYSSGCLMYELLVGRPPFIGDGPASITLQHLCDVPAPPSQLNAAVDAEVDAVVLRALAKSPDDRYQSARDMKADVAALSKRIAAVPVGASAGSSAQVRAFVSRVGGPPLRGVRARTRPRRATSPAPAGKRRRSALAAVAIAAVVFPLGGFGLYNFNQPGSSEAQGASLSQVLQAPKAHADVLPGAAVDESATRQPVLSSGTQAPASKIEAAAAHSSPTSSATRAASSAELSRTGGPGVGGGDAGSRPFSMSTVHNPPRPVDSAATDTREPASTTSATISTEPTKRSAAQQPAAAGQPPVSQQPTPVRSVQPVQAPAPSHSPRAAKPPRAASPTPAVRPARPTASKPAPKPTHSSQPSSPVTSRPATPRSNRPATKRPAAVSPSHGHGSKGGHAARPNRPPTQPRGNTSGSAAPGAPEHVKPAKHVNPVKHLKKAKHLKKVKPGVHKKDAKRVKAARVAAKATKPAARRGHQRREAAKPTNPVAAPPAVTPGNGGAGHGKGRDKRKP